MNYLTNKKDVYTNLTTTKENKNKYLTLQHTAATTIKKWLPGQKKQGITQRI